MLKGEVDLNTAAEFVLAAMALQKESFLNVGTIAAFQNEYVIGRADKGIHEVSDLRAKKIGLTRRTSTEFNFGRFLELNGLSLEQVSIVDLSPERAFNALLESTVDAVVVWEPYAGMAKDRLGNAAVLWSSQCGQPKYWNLIGTASWITRHPDLVSRVLKSLAQAEDFLDSSSG